jgi:hypothetical protein
LNEKKEAFTIEKETSTSHGVLIEMDPGMIRGSRRAAVNNIGNHVVQLIRPWTEPKNDDRA